MEETIIISFEEGENLPRARCKAHGQRLVHLNSSLVMRLPMLAALIFRDYKIKGTTWFMCFRRKTFRNRKFCCWLPKETSQLEFLAQVFGLR